MNRQLYTLTNDELLLRIVAAEQDCTHVWRTSEPGVYQHEGTPPVPLALPLAVPHPRECMCNGTGKEPVLSARLMRLPCPESSVVFGHMLEDPVYCLACQGRNWIPNPDSWAMWRALKAAGILAKFSLVSTFGALVVINEKDNFVSDDDPERAFLLAVAKVFEDMGGV